ncbi:MAG: beta-galactosidase trimerization domain-containing protein [Planctomycetota bacterium]
MRNALRILVVVVLGMGVAGNLPGAEDFRKYVRESKDFKRVSQKKEMLLPEGRWDHWIFMPWRYDWGKKYDEAVAEELAKAGFNGGYCDFRPGDDAKLHEKYGFLWYMDHTAGKRYFKTAKKLDRSERMSPNRPVCLLDPEVQARKKKEVRDAVTQSLAYKNRAAYAFDDEIGWSFFTSPTKWDNNPLSLADFSRWLKERYGSEEDLKRQWTSGAPEGVSDLVSWGKWPAGEPYPSDYVKRMANPDDYLELFKQPMSEWNLSAFCDALSYMDSQFNNVLGDFVDVANQIDPETPCGVVGMHAPAAYSGSDYAKVMRKVQFLEAYDIGGAMEINRSFSPGNMMPLVRTGFGDPVKAQSSWYNWYYMVHGDRGIIYWAEKWFTDKLPMEHIKKAGPDIKRIADGSRKIFGATWVHDGVALYYSHPSIQVSWFIDIETHKKTWGGRGSSLSNALCSSVGTTWSWQKFLEDQRIQYNWYSYADLLEKGIDPKEYKVLILPRVLCLSKEEAEEIRKYVEAGGCVIADHQTGIFDQHGKAYPGGKGILDDLFGIEKRPVCKKEALFYGKIFGEKDDDKNSNKNYIEAGLETWSQCRREKGLVMAQRDMPCFVRKTTGKGWACHMNISLMEYSAVRSQGTDAAAAYVAPVVALIRETGVKPWVKLDMGGKEPDITEAVYWKKDGRIVVCVVKNPLKFASIEGETKTEGVVRDTRDLTVIFSGRKEKVVDEASGKDLGSGDRFTVPWKMDEAAVISFAEGR